MKIYKKALYLKDIKNVAELKLPWEKLNNKSILLSGGSGLIGSFLVDVIMYRNLYYDMHCKIFIICRNKLKAKERFSMYLNNIFFHLIEHDINFPLNHINDIKADYILHLASNTHPVAYATDPIGTITTNIFGVKNMLDYALTTETKRFIFSSSNEIYGENRGDVDKFKEDYCGYIDCNTLRAGYPESKRCSEALCKAYEIHNDLDIVIARLTRTYGPTMLMSDSKAVSQFVLNGISNKDIILKSNGKQYYSFMYVADSVSAILTLLFYGKKGEAYNISDELSDITLKDLSDYIAKVSGVKVIKELPNKVEAAGFSKVTKALLDNSKLKRLGWEAKYNIYEGISRTIDILQDI